VGKITNFSNAVGLVFTTPRAPMGCCGCTPYRTGYVRHPGPLRILFVRAARRPCRPNPTPIPQVVLPIAHHPRYGGTTALITVLRAERRATSMARSAARWWHATPRSSPSTVYCRAAPFIYFLQAIWPPEMSRVLCQDRLYCPRSTAGAGTERRALSTSWERLEGTPLRSDTTRTLALSPSLSTCGPPVIWLAARGIFRAVGAGDSRLRWLLGARWGGSTASPDGDILFPSSGVCP
jgi:hypothetical protein